MSIESRDGGDGGNKFLQTLGTFLILSAGAGFMLFTKSSPKHVLFELVYDDANYIKFTMSDVDAACLASVTIGMLALWASKSKGS